MKVARPVWRWGKGRDNMKALPMPIEESFGKRVLISSVYWERLSSILLDK